MSRSKDRYKNDPDYRDLQIKRSALRYWREKPLITRPSPELFKTDLYAHLPINNPEDLRYGMTVTMPMYRIGTVAKLLGKSPQSVRKWQQDGTIPHSGLELYRGGRNDRGYTYDQLRLMWELLPLLNFSDQRGDSFAPFSRKLHHYWLQMPDGVVPVYGA